MLTVIPHQTKQEKPPLSIGETVYLIEETNKFGKVYFQYCYLKKEDAELVLENIKLCLSQVNNPYKILDNNFYDDPEHPDLITDLNASKEE